MKLKLNIVCIILALTTLGVQADAFLWDLGISTNSANNGTIADFTALGVTEDLTGATVSQILASTNSAMTDGTITLSYLSGVAQNSNAYIEPNGVLVDYLYLQDGDAAGPVNMQISGLSSALQPNTTYGFYLIGLGDAADQTAVFTYGGTPLTTTSADPAVRFSFVTDASVSDDTLAFTWAREGANTYSGFNGFAIAAVPEPATAGLFGLFAIAMYVLRKNTIRKKQE